jgi:hypothetical protein
MTALCTLAANLGTVESREDLMLLGTGSFFRGVKRPRREADHPPPPSFEVKMRGAIPALLPMNS